MEHKEQIEQLSNKLDKDLQNLLYTNYNYLPTMTSTFQCIENSSESFKELIRHSMSLEQTVKKEIGRALSFYINTQKPISPPYTKYFHAILTSLILKEIDNI